MAKMGRKTLREEVMMHKVINLAWVTLHDALVSDKVPMDMKIDIAKVVAPKAIPKNINVEMKDPFNIVIQTNQQKNITPKKEELEPTKVIEIQSNAAAS